MAFRSLHLYRAFAVLCVFVLLRGASLADINLEISGRGNTVDSGVTFDDGHAYISSRHGRAVGGEGVTFELSFTNSTGSEVTYYYRGLQAAGDLHSYSGMHSWTSNRSITVPAATTGVYVMEADYRPRWYVNFNSPQPEGINSGVPFNGYIELAAQLYTDNTYTVPDGDLVTERIIVDAPAGLLYGANSDITNIYSGSDTITLNMVTPPGFPTTLDLTINNNTSESITPTVEYFDVEFGDDITVSTGALIAAFSSGVMTETVYTPIDVDLNLITVLGFVPSLLTGDASPYDVGTGGTTWEGVFQLGENPSAYSVRFIVTQQTDIETTIDVLGNFDGGAIIVPAGLAGQSIHTTYDVTMSGLPGEVMAMSTGTAGVVLLDGEAPAEFGFVGRVYTYRVYIVPTGETEVASVEVHESFSVDEDGSTSTLRIERFTNPDGSLTIVGRGVENFDQGKGFGEADGTQTGTNTTSGAVGDAVTAAALTGGGTLADPQGVHAPITGTPTGDDMEERAEEAGGLLRQAGDSIFTFVDGLGTVLDPNLFDSAGTLSGINVDIPPMSVLPVGYSFVIKVDYYWITVVRGIFKFVFMIGSFFALLQILKH